MAMSGVGQTSCLVAGPVPFKDVSKDDDDDHTISPSLEYADIISTLPSICRSGMRLRCYQDVWLFDHIVPGMISVQRRFKPRRGDVLLASPPKCGTTWLKSLCFATMARAAYPPSAADHPLVRLNPHECVPFMEALFSAGQEAKLDALPSPRLLHTHMHHSMLPPSVADNPHCKIVYVCRRTDGRPAGRRQYREPKDMLVSLWHFIKGVIGDGTMPSSEVFELGCEGKNHYGPIWDHILGYWSASKATPGRVLFLRYEKMLADPVSTVQELARFLGVPFTAAEEADGSPSDIARLCSIDTMRGLQGNTTGKSGTFFKFPHQAFFRKGVVGDWVNHMTPEMARRIDAIVEDKLRGSGLTFTS